MHVVSAPSGSSLGALGLHPSPITSAPSINTLVTSSSLNWVPWHIPCCPAAIPYPQACQAALWVPPHHFKYKHSSPTLAVSLWVQPLILCHHHIILSPTAHSLPPPSLWAPALVVHPHCIFSSSTAHLPPPPWFYKPKCLFTFLTTSFQAQGTFPLPPMCSIKLIQTPLLMFHPAVFPQVLSLVIAIVFLEHHCLTVCVLPPLCVMDFVPLTDISYISLLPSPPQYFSVKNFFTFLPISFP